jgi:uncharacterized membrane protein YfcA
MSLPVVGVTSLVGAIFHWRLGNVRLGTAALFGTLAMAGAYAGARLALLMSGGAQLALLAVVILAAAASMLRGRRSAASSDVVADGDRDATTHTAPVTGRAALPLLVPAAIGVGVLTGLVGIGGGFLVVPALVLLARVPMREAVGTSLLVIAMNCASGFVGHLAHTAVDWRFLALFTSLAVVGVLAGTLTASHVPQATLRRGFAVFLLAIGGFVLYKNRGVFAGPRRTDRASAPRTVRRSPSAVETPLGRLHGQRQTANG